MDYEELDDFIMLFKEELKFEYHMLETLQQLLTKFLDINNTPVNDAWSFIMQFKLLLSQEIISQRKATKKFENAMRK